MNKALEVQRRRLNRPGAPALMAAILLASFASPSGQAANLNVSYTQQTAYYPTLYTSGSSGDFNQGSTQLGMYANNSGSKQVVAWRTLLTAGNVASGTARTLQVGDVFSIGVSAERAYGEIGFSLNAGGTQSGSWANRQSGSRLNFNLDGPAYTSGYGNWYVNANGSSPSYGVAGSQSSYQDFYFNVRITSATTADTWLTAGGTTNRAYNLTMNGSANIDTLAVYLQDDYNGSSSANIYWEQPAGVTNSGLVQLGYYLTSGTFTPGLISDGLEADSTSISSPNTVFIGGNAGTAVILNQANTYTGGTTLNSGATLNVGAAENAGTSGPLGKSGTITLGGGTLQYSSANQYDYSGRFSTASSQAYTIDVNGQSVGFASNLTSSGGSLTLSDSAGGGKLTLSGANTYSGGTTLKAGTLSVNTIADSGTSAIGNSGTFTLAGGTLAYTGSGAATTARAFTGTGGTTSTINLTGGNLTLSGAITGGSAFTVVKTNTGLLTLSGTGDNSFLQATVNGGTLVLNKTSSSSAHALGGTAETVNSGGLLQLSGTGGDQIQDGASVTVNSGGGFDLNGQTEAINSLTLNGTGIGGTGALTNSSASAATLTLNSGSVLGSASTIGGTGNVTINGAGALTAIALTTLTKVGTNTLNLANGTNLDNINLNLQVNAGTVILNKTGTTGPGSGHIHAAGTVTINNGGSVQLQGSGGYQIYDGLNTTINSGGVLDMAGQNQTFGAGILNISGTGISGGGALINSSSSASTLTGAMTLGADSSVGGNGSGGLTISGVVSDGGSGYSLTKVGSGTLTLQGACTYNGNTIISGGTLALGATGTLPAATTVNLNGGTLAMGTFNNTVNAVQASGSVLAKGTWGASGSGANHISSAITGTGILTVSTGGSTSSAVTSSANPSIYGNSILFTNTVTGSGGDGSAPGGPVTFYDGGTAIGAGTLISSSGTVSRYTLTINSLTTGTHSITASYAGNASYDVSTSSALSQVVNQATSTATVAVNNSPATYNGSGQAATVTLSGTNTAGTLTVLTGGQALQTNAGTYTVTATFLPNNTNYTTLTGLSAGNFTLNPATSTATVAVNNSPATYNGSGQAATVTLSGTNTIGTLTILTGGQALQTNANTYVVTATFVPNNTNYTTLTGLSAGNFTINKGTTVLSWGNPSDITYGTALSGTQLNATAGGVAGAFVYTPASGTVLGAHNAQTLSVQFTPTDTNNYSTPALKTVSINVNPASLTITANAQSKSYGTLLALGTSAFTATGLTNGDSVSSATLTSAGATNTAAVGSYAITVTNAVGSGLTNYNISYVNGTLTVGQANSANLVSSSENPSGYHDNVSFTNTLNGDATGYVLFSTTNGLLSSNLLSGGVAISSGITSLPRGTNLITAIYAGDVNYLSATNSLAQVVTNHPPVANGTAYSRNSLPTWKMTLSDLLTNASDADGDTLTLVSVGPSTNGITLDTNSIPGSVAYANTNPVDDTFPYTVTDGFGGTNTGTITLTYLNTNGETGTNSIATIAGGNPTTLTAYGIPGYNYITERSTNLSPAVWVNISTNTAATNGVITILDYFSDLGSNAPASAYYRLKWQ